MGNLTQFRVGEPGRLPAGPIPVMIGAEGHEAYLRAVRRCMVKRKIGTIMMIAVLGVLLGVAPASATTDRADWRCTMAGSFSDALPPYATHWRIGARAFSIGRVVYWLHERVVNGQLRFDYADRAVCDNPFFVGSPVAVLSPSPSAGQPTCTSPGTFSTVVDGLIGTYHFVGQVNSTVGTYFPTTYNYRFWHVEIQRQLGQWSWHESIVARC